MPSAVLAITGASGARYGVRLLKALSEAGWEVHLIVTREGRINLELECEVSAEELAAVSVPSLEKADRSFAIFSILVSARTIVSRLAVTSPTVTGVTSLSKIPASQAAAAR